MANYSWVKFYSEFADNTILIILIPAEERKDED